MKKLAIPKEDQIATSGLEDLSFRPLEEMLTGMSESIELNKMDLSNKLDAKFKSKPLPETEFKEFKNIKLKDRLDYADNMDLNNYAVNPVDSIVLDNNWIPEIELARVSARPITRKNTTIYTRNMVLALVMVGLLVTSVSLNGFFLKSLDPLLINVVSAPYRITSSVVAAINGLFYNFAVKPYVVTVGEYGNLAVAKDAAIELLPRFKQINIIELDSGIYTFEIQRFASKDNAYKIAKNFLKDDLNLVHVRYIPTKK